jgi:hypothetical protein
MAAPISRTLPALRNLQPMGWSRKKNINQSDIREPAMAITTESVTGKGE